MVSIDRTYDVVVSGCRECVRKDERVKSDALTGFNRVRYVTETIRHFHKLHISKMYDNTRLLNGVRYVRERV